MIKKPDPWRRISRENLIDTKFLKVYQDTIQLPSGDIFDDYSIVSLPNGVIIVATDADNKLITQFEYKYAIDKVILNLPSGGVGKNETPIQAAKKELLEETGYASDEVELVKTLYEYPSKLDHVLYIVRIKNAKKIQQVSHEATESISEVNLLSADMPDFGGEFNATYVIAALAVTLPKFLRN
ncbi:MAG: hydrolase [Candidatus Saccharibacteria bacterium]|nr:hydrolase [Candidatus Saccharibacteria bacterium]